MSTRAKSSGNYKRLAGYSEPLRFSEGTPLLELYKRRVRKNQDLSILVTDWHNRRGTGKTTLSLRLAETLDRDGGLTSDKCTLSPEEMTDAYVSMNKGSGLVLDEAEAGLSKYQAGSYINRAMRKIVSMGRVREKYLILNAPAGAEIDRDLKALFDVWILVQQRGQALVHFIKYEPYNSKVLTEKKQVIEWQQNEEEQLEEVYQELHDQKITHLKREEEDFLPMKKVNEKVRKGKKEARRETRDEIIRKLINDLDYGPSDIHEAVDLSQQRVGQIARE